MITAGELEVPKNAFASSFAVMQDVIPQERGPDSDAAGKLLDMSRKWRDAMLFLLLRSSDYMVALIDPANMAFPCASLFKA